MKRNALLLAGLLLAQPGLASTLPDSARSGDAGQALQLLREGADPNATLADGSSALLWAAYQEQAELVQALLAAGANPKQANDYGITPMLAACRNGNPAIISALIEAGIDPDAPMREGETPLMVAALGGHEAAVALLLERGADPDAAEAWRGQTALMWAAAENHAAVVKQLLEAGAKVDLLSKEFDYRDLPPKRGSVGMVFPRGGFSALMFAARDGALDSARVLLAHGADPNLSEPDQISPLIMAITNFHYDIAALLLDHGAEVNLQDASGRTALYAAVDMHSMDTTNRPSPQPTDQYDSLAIIQRLLASPGIQVDLAISQPIEPRAVLDGADFALGAGTTPLIRAARGADLEVLQLLVDSGADLHHRLESGANALMLATGLQWRDGKTHGSAEQALAVTRYLLEQGADVAVRDNKGNAVLHGAAYRGLDPVIKVLVEYGAEVSIENAEGQSPLDVAASIGGTRNALVSTVALLESLASSH